MELLRAMNWDELKREYDLDGKRLLPWEGWPTPFGGAWCVVRPRSSSLRHGHDEQEMFIVIAGAATIHVGHASYAVKKGDVMAITPNAEHYVSNQSDEDFHFYSLWWDRASCEDFLANIKGHLQCPDI